MFTTILCSTGNPDHGQYAPLSPELTAVVNSLEEAVLACSKYINEWNLGSSNWCGDAGKVFQTDKFVASIAYNGKVLTT